MVSTDTHTAIVHTSEPDAKILMKVTLPLQHLLTCKEEAQEVMKNWTGDKISSKIDKYCSKTTPVEKKYQLVIILLIV